MAYDYYIAFGAGGWPRGQYYEGDKEQWKDADVPQRPGQFYTFVPNPERPTYDDWLFDGHDGDNSSWAAP